MEDVREERKGTNMGDTVILATVYFPLIMVGMVWVIIWSLERRTVASQRIRP